MTHTAPPARTRPAPELVAAVIAAIVWGVIGLGLIITAGAGAARSTPTPSANAASATPRPSPTMEGGLLVLIRSSNARLDEQGQVLTDLLGAESIDTAEIQTAVRQVNATATFASGVADRLSAQPGGAPIAKELNDAYGAIMTQSEKTLALGLANGSGYRKGAAKLVKLIDAVPDVDELLAAASSASPTASGSASSSPGPSGTDEPTATPKPSPTPKPTPERTESATPSPTTGPSASPTSLAGNLIVNPGFESGSAPWEFVLGPGATGTFTVTTDGAASGSAAGQILVTSGGGPWSAASLRQGGFALQNGTIYHVTLSARAAGPRDIRVRITTSSGAVIASRILSVGIAWASTGFEFTAIGSIEGAALVVETGIAAQTVWLDDLGLAP